VVLIPLVDGGGIFTPLGGGGKIPELKPPALGFALDLPDTSVPSFF
jgi:hypothetical protein